MRILSTTLAGPGTEHLIGDALRSVADLVDASLILWTGPVDGVRCPVVCDPFSVVPWRTEAWPWRDDFGAARNAALDFARAERADWALTLDTDERIEFASVAEVRRSLGETPHGCLSAFCVDGSYAKPRLIRLPTPVRWQGRTHEAFPAHEDPRGEGVIRGLRFNELPKTPEQLRAKFERDARILNEELVRDPRCGRTRYYLGDAYEGLGQLHAAALAFQGCAALPGWDEERAWACYRAGMILLGLGEYDKAIAMCAEGLAIHAGISELAWLAGLASLRSGRLEQAVRWAKLAEVHTSGSFGLAGRRGFRHPWALEHGPADVLRHALAALG